MCGSLQSVTAARDLVSCLAGCMQGRRVHAGPQQHVVRWLPAAHCLHATAVDRYAPLSACSTCTCRQRRGMQAVFWSPAPHTRGVLACSQSRLTCTGGGWRLPPRCPACGSRRWQAGDRLGVTCSRLGSPCQHRRQKAGSRRGKQVPLEAGTGTLSAPTNKRA